MIDDDSMGPGLKLVEARFLISEFPSRKAITRVRTSPNVDISRHSNGHVSVVRDATVTWLSTLVVLHLLYTSICIALYHDSSLKLSNMARVNEGSHSITCHPHVYPQVE